MADKLGKQALETALAKLPQWAVDGETITRTFKFKDFSEAFGFMTRAALAAQAADHHPDWSNSYNKVTITLSTHTSGGVTEKDISLANAIDKIAG